jgi:hypothetical protein
MVTQAVGPLAVAIMRIYCITALLVQHGECTKVSAAEIAACCSLLVNLFHGAAAAAF